MRLEWSTFLLYPQKFPILNNFRLLVLIQLADDPFGLAVSLLYRSAIVNLILLSKNNYNNIYLID
jgi:hypothetical protein